MQSTETPRIRSCSVKTDILDFYGYKDFININDSMESSKWSRRSFCENSHVSFMRC